MKILTDSVGFDIQTIGGVSRYHFELIEGMTRFQINLILPFYKSANRYLISLEEIKSIEKGSSLYEKMYQQNWIRNWMIKLNIDNYRIENINNTIDYIKKDEFDIFHPSFYSTYYLNSILKKPLVITIHDMTHELYPELFKTYDRTKNVKKLLINKADHIIVVSENTKKDLIKFYPAASEKITVTYLASKIEKKENMVKTNILPYILFVGGRDNYKNFWLCLESIKNILINQNIQLICIGRLFTKLERQNIERLRLDKLLIAKSCSDDELSNYYGSALMLLYPSLYEGFGLPILEAMQCGCPVMCSNSSSLPEVGGDAVMYFDPLDPDDIQQKLLSLLANQQLRKEMINLGKIRSKKFNWDITVSQTVEIYKNLI